MLGAPKGWLGLELPKVEPNMLDPPKPPNVDAEEDGNPPKPIPALDWPKPNPGALELATPKPKPIAALLGWLKAKGEAA